MSILAEPLPNVLSAEAANERMAAGQRVAAGMEARLARQYESSLRATAKRCADAYRERTHVLTAALPTPHHDQPPQPTVDEVMKAELAAASAAARTQATRRKIVAAVAGEILAGFGPEPQLRPLLEPLVRQQAGVQAERLVEGTRDAVASILLDALTEGWSVPETAAQIQSALTEQAAWRATMLARTDLIALSNGAAQQAATILGDSGPQYKTWLTAGDDRVRPDHVDANRQTVGINEPFQVGDSLLQYPGDPAGADADTINCRCVSIFSDSPVPTLRHTQDGGIEDGIAVLASAALDELLAGVFDPVQHPRNPKGRREGGRWRSLAELQDSHYHVDSGVTEWGDAISIHSIEAHPTGEGHGAAFLQDIISYSEQTGKPLYLTPAQVGGEGLSTAQLEAWYGRHGFRWQGRKMVREPGFALTAAFDPAKHPHVPAGSSKGGEWAPKGVLHPSVYLEQEETIPATNEVGTVRLYRGVDPGRQEYNITNPRPSVLSKNQGLFFTTSWESARVYALDDNHVFAVDIPEEEALQRISMRTVGGMQYGDLTPIAATEFILTAEVARKALRAPRVSLPQEESRYAATSKMTASANCPYCAPDELCALHLPAA